MDSAKQSKQSAERAESARRLGQQLRWLVEAGPLKSGVVQIRIDVDYAGAGMVVIKAVDEHAGPRIGFMTFMPGVQTIEQAFYKVFSGEIKWQVDRWPSKGQRRLTADTGSSADLDEFDITVE